MFPIPILKMWCAGWGTKRFKIFYCIISSFNFIYCSIQLELFRIVSFGIFSVFHFYKNKFSIILFLLYVLYFLLSSMLYSNGSNEDFVLYCNNTSIKVWWSLQFSKSVVHDTQNACNGVQSYKIFVGAETLWIV